MDLVTEIEASVARLTNIKACLMLKEKQLRGLAELQNRIHELTKLNMSMMQAACSRIPLTYKNDAGVFLTLRLNLEGQVDGVELRHEAQNTLVLTEAMTRFSVYQVEEDNDSSKNETPLVEDYLEDEVIEGDMMLEAVDDEQEVTEIPPTESSKSPPPKKKSKKKVASNKPLEKWSKKNNLPPQCLPYRHRC